MYIHLKGDWRKPEQAEVSLLCLHTDFLLKPQVKVTLWPVIPGKPCILIGKEERGFTRSYITQLRDPLTEYTYCRLNYGILVETMFCKHNTPESRDLDMATLSDLVRLVAGHASPDPRLHPGRGKAISTLSTTILSALNSNGALSCRSRASSEATCQSICHPSFSYSHYNASQFSWTLMIRYQRKVSTTADFLLQRRSPPA